MSQAIQLSVLPRDTVGTRPSRRLRRQQLVPAIIYGGNRAPLPVSIPLSALQRAMQEDSFYTSILELQTGKRTEKAVLKAMAQHPVRNEPVHLDFLRASEDTYVSMPIPFRFINEDSCIGIRESGGVITHQMTQVTVNVQANNIPDYLEVDMAEIPLSQPIHLSAIPLPDGVRIPILEQGQDPSVAIVMPPRLATDADAEGAEGAGAADEQQAEAEGGGASGAEDKN